MTTEEEVIIMKDAEEIAGAIIDPRPAWMSDEDGDYQVTDDDRERAAEVAAEIQAQIQAGECSSEGCCEDTVEEEQTIEVRIPKPTDAGFMRRLGTIGKIRDAVYTRRAGARQECLYFGDSTAHG